MKFSVLIPAHNEENFIGKCFASIEEARKNTTHEVEVIVCLNHCTDRTREISEVFGAVVVSEEERNLSKVRNRAASAATGDVIVTIDADSRMSANMFQQIEAKLASGKYIGGGTIIRPERLSLGIIISGLMIFPLGLIHGITSAGLFWCYRKDFESIGGFDESLLTLEDLDFAKRLRAYGKLSRRRFGTVYKGSIITSCRKFDRFGDWYFVRNPGEVLKLFTGKNKELADKYYYEFKC